MSFYLILNFQLPVLAQSFLSSASQGLEQPSSLTALGCATYKHARREGARVAQASLLLLLLLLSLPLSLPLLVLSLSVK